MKLKHIVFAISLGLGTAALATPPEHAAAHGKRMQHEGHEMVFDSERQVYVVQGQDGVYFHDGSFYTVDGNTWMRSEVLDGADWEIVDATDLPNKLLTVQRAPAAAGGPPDHAAAAGGPPDHAPAHGYRMQHEGVDLVFDEQRQVYLVEGRERVFFHDGAFFTVQDNTWVRADSLDDDVEWKVVEIESQPDLLPESLIAAETPDLAIELDIG